MKRSPLLVACAVIFLLLARHGEEPVQAGGGDVEESQFLVDHNWDWEV